MRQYSTFRVQRDYAVPLLEVLASMPGHQAAPRAVIAEIERRHGERIPPEQREKVPSGTDVRWENWVAWERANLIRLGLMAAPAPGIWAITEAGLQWLRDNPSATHIGRAPQPRVPREKGATGRKPAVQRRRPAQEDEQQRVMDIYRRELRAIRELLAGRGARPSDERLCDWVQFCYTFELYAEGHQLFSLVDARAVNDWLYQRTSRLARVCAAKARG